MHKAPKDPTRFTRLIGVAVLILFIGICVFVALRSDFLKIFANPDALRAAIQSFGLWAPLVFFLMQVLQVLLAPIPGNVMTLVGGVLFGFWPALCLSIAAVLVGSILVFLLAQKLGRRFVALFVPQNIMEKYDHIITEKQNVTLYVMFLLPFFPDDFLCFIAGLSSFSLKHFCVMVLLTRPWGLVFSALLGSGAFSVPLWMWAIIALAVGALMYVSVRYGAAIEEWLLQKIRRNKTAG